MRLAIAAALAAGMAAGGAAAQSVTLAVGAPWTSLDPHFHNLSPNGAVADMLFDNLVMQDERARVIPGLAESWRPVAPDVWEFRLRPGVTFHNGSALTAEDIAFTLRRIPEVPNSPSSYALYSRSARAVEIVDPLTLRIRTDGPYPLLPVDMAQFAILDRETHEGATTEQFNGGSMAIGTGPFRLQRHAMGDRLELVRNDNYWGQKAAWERVTYRAIVNEAARTAALLAGDVDAIDQVPTSDVARLRRDARIQISEIQSNRVIYLAMDHGRAEASPFVTDNDGRPIQQNPLRDLRVRQALSIAIDRAAIVERVMEGAATPTGQFLPEGAFGNDPTIPVPQADPARARALLAEAGYPQGFRITLHGPNNRYINDAQTIQAIAQMWTRVGVRTAVEAQPWATFVARAARGEFSAFLVGWGSGTGEASSPLRSLVATVDASRGLGASNRGRYSNPQMDAVLLRGLSELDDPRREALFQEATQIAMADVGIIPLHIQKNLWAMRRTVRHVPRTDELTRAQDFAPAR